MSPAGSRVAVQPIRSAARSETSENSAFGTVPAHAAMKLNAPKRVYRVFRSTVVIGLSQPVARSRRSPPIWRTGGLDTVARPRHWGTGGSLRPRFGLSGPGVKIDSLPPGVLRVVPLQVIRGMRSRAATHTGSTLATPSTRRWTSGSASSARPTWRGPANGRRCPRTSSGILGRLRGG